MPLSWTIDADIRRAATLPAEVYSDPRWFAAVVRPLAPDRTRVSFLSYVWNPYSPSREQGPHHFHRLLERFLA